MHRRSIMTLYYHNNDPYGQSVRIALAEKAISCDLIELNSSKEAQDTVAELNPYNEVPLLVDRELVIYNSKIIMEYLDERFPHPPLMPVYPAAKSKSRTLLYRIDRDWYSLMNKILSKDSTEIEKTKARNALRDSIVSITPVFSEFSYFMSEEFSLVDCAIAPLLWRLNYLGINLPPQAAPVLEYIKRVCSRETFQASLTDLELRMNKV